MSETTTDSPTLEAGTYEILRRRLGDAGRDLAGRLEQLNTARHEVFGALETALVATGRVTTENNCLPRDMVAIGTNRFLFGFNVHLGLRRETKLEDVFSAFEWSEETFRPLPLDFLGNPEFLEDFRSLFKYYRDTVFARFGFVGPHLFFVFQVGKDVTDIKTFKWVVREGAFEYLGNRSDHEFVYPPQQEFEWKRTHRDLHRAGEHPHISIEESVFVETVGGDLTIKIEDNTDSGEGILTEPVEHADQTLDDAEVFYARVGRLLLLRIRPYLEKAWRFYIYNEKLEEVHRIDAIEAACLLLPAGQGILFPSGTYLESGVLKQFDSNATDVAFDRKIVAPNREDFLYVFHNRERGDYLLMPYNLITQSVETPIHCHGFSLFENGEMALFRSERDPQKHHTVQIWKTPFCGPDYQASTRSDSYLFKIGNPELVRCMAECHEILGLIRREQGYATLYVELEKRTRDVLDSYFWLDRDETARLQEPLRSIVGIAGQAIDEYDKVRALQKQAASSLRALESEVEETLRARTLAPDPGIDGYVSGLHALRTLRGRLIELREVRFIDLGAVDRLETQVGQTIEGLSSECAEFLLRKEALDPYRRQLEQLGGKVSSVGRVADGRELEQAIEKAGAELQLLIEIVGNLHIEDATQTTQILEQISALYAELNRFLAQLRQRIRELRGQEGAAQFAAQLQLLSQTVANAVERAETPERCDELLGQLMVQMEELDGRFADFDEFLVQLAEKRTEISAIFETRKLALTEARNKRAASLVAVADRLLSSVAHRLASCESVAEIHSLYASDRMVDRLREVVKELVELGDPVKADDVQGRLKSSREEAVRQLRDKQELFVGGRNVVAFGSHHFNVNTQPIELTVLPREDHLALHLTATRYFETIEDAEVEELRDVWGLTLPSESEQVYRGEYLAFSFLRQLEEAGRLEEAVGWSEPERLAAIREFMAPRYSDAYVKGVHDQDAASIFAVLARVHHAAGELRFAPAARALAISAWEQKPEAVLEAQLRSYGTMRKHFSDAGAPGRYLERLREQVAAFCRGTGLYPEADAGAAAAYLFEVLSRNGEFQFSREGFSLFEQFGKALHQRHLSGAFEGLEAPVRGDFVRHVELLRDWFDGLIRAEAGPLARFRDEAILLALRGLHNRYQVREVALEETIAPMLGEHPQIREGTYAFDYLDFMERLARQTRETAPRFEAFQKAKRRVVETARDRLRPEEFRPRVLSSFVRNQLVDRVLLPLIGTNLAKQMGTADANTRTDRMGLLLLVSPPGYGKTTLMEYIASRLGVVFLKINGPAIGHAVTSLDPAEAPNAAARDELRKLNLGFEMGDNLVIYLDDIQHCHPEFLQKFISLCDGQRRIEGISQGKGRTFDFRGRKVAVVMAGNPYTESGEAFRIPDMLANRADTYNLGDLVNGAHFEAFKASYLENAITSNATLNPLAAGPRADLLKLIAAAEQGRSEGLDLEGSHSARGIDDCLAVLRKLVTVRDVILKVNAEYIRSAAQADAYRTEPPFLLQGSYRNMNRLAERIVPVMNDAELDALIEEHYGNEAQTLTTGAEANLLKFHELLGKLTPEEADRWEAIRKTFRRNLLVQGGDEEGPVGQVVRQLAGFNQGLESLGETIRCAAEQVHPPAPAPLPPPTPGGEKVAVNPETLRKIWELIESQDADGTEMTIEVPRG